jgi:hypothetical protein
MPGVLAPYATAGVALAAASMIATAPATQPVAGVAVEQHATRLLASSVANIPANLLIAIANIPYYESLALKEYAYALGPPRQTGGVPGWIPPGATVENGGVDPGPDGVEGTADDLYARGGTGSWWMESPSGNTWGWDDGNWPQLAAIGFFIAPFEFSLPIAQQLQIFAQAEFIAGANVNCEFQCADILGYVGRWLVFVTPLAELLAGTTFPETVNAYPDIQPVWAGEPAQLDPSLPLQAIAEYLTQDPRDNPIMLPDLAGVASDLVKLGNDLINDFNPFVTGSFLYWGAPTLYSVPAALGGLVQNFTGIPNQFLIPPWENFGGEPDWGPTAGPASLLTGLPAGLDYLVRGLSGYLNPSTYLQASLANTLLRTYAEGSLPGSDIARILIGMDPASVLALGNDLRQTASTGWPAPGISSLIRGITHNLPAAGLPNEGGTPVSTAPTGGGTGAIASTENTLTPTNRRLVTLDVAPGSEVAPSQQAASIPPLEEPPANSPKQATGETSAVADVVNSNRPEPASGTSEVAASPPKKATRETNDVRDSLKFEPPTRNKSGATNGNSDRPGATVRSVANGVRDAVKGALGGASKGDTGK